MDYEKAYKDALERAKEFQKSKDGLCVLTAESIFPELKESEDERIRKTLIRVLNENVGNGIEKYGAKLEDALAWLEKQGEKKATDKVEPKFKVGDWIVNNEDGSIGQITDIIYDESGYGYNHTNGWLHSVFEKDFHLWTIQDAKDGDVLACGDKVTDCPFIFHNLTEEQNPRSYCGINTSGDFQYNDENGGFWCKSDEVRPATKEQRELLFKKMKEAGYQWNPDTKELKKIEQKPTWSEDDESTLNELIIGFYAYRDQYPNFWKLRTDEIIEWLKRKKDEHTIDNG